MKKSYVTRVMEVVWIEIVITEYFVMNANTQF